MRLGGALDFGGGVFFLHGGGLGVALKSAIIRRLSEAKGQKTTALGIQKASRKKIVMLRAVVRASHTLMRFVHCRTFLTDPHFWRASPPSDILARAS
jgi:hypothetical protein